MGAMGLTLPTDHQSLDVWGAILNTALGLVESHNHTAGNGNLVPTGGLSIDADLAFNTKAITGLKAIDFTAVATSAVSSYAGAFFVNSADSNLYYRTTAGVNVQVTNGAALNVSAFTGGIGGDYASVGALFSFDDATDSYWAQQELVLGVRKWAGLRVGNVDIYEQAASITNRVRINSPAALAASYAITLGAAVPGAQAIVQIGTSGALTYSNTLASNQNLTLQGTGRVVHGSWSKTFTIHPDTVPSGSVSGGTDGGGGFGSSIMAVSTVMYSRLDGFLTTDTITGVTLGVSILTGASLTFDLMTRDNTGTLTSVLAAPTTSTTLTPTAPFVPGTGTVYLKATTDGSTTAALYTATAAFTG